jgi:hypothetical protein
MRNCCIINNILASLLVDCKFSDFFWPAGYILSTFYQKADYLCGQVVRVPGCRFRGPGLLPGATRFSEK